MMTAASREIFFYRNMNKRVIQFKTVDTNRFERLGGPLIYVVTDIGGVIRYVGRHLAGTPLRSRWIRRDHLHHQESSRNLFIAHLEAGDGDLLVSCASAPEIHRALPSTRSIGDARTLVCALEALWIRRYGRNLWNVQAPAVPAGFTDDMKEPSTEGMGGQGR